jgi:EmrB/QacA subfamily drug resistance transporter
VLLERARPARIREHPNAGWFAVGTVCMGAFMGQLDASIVTLTFPDIQQEFAAPLAGVQWVSLAYLLTLVALVAAAGRIADATGRKAMYLAGFIVFTAASAACALAPTLEWLIVLRVVQAIGAALLQANSVALVVQSVPRSRMQEALGIQAGAQALGLGLGPTLGGVLIAALGWRWVFWVNVPVGAIALVSGHYLLPRTRERTPLGDFDAIGLVLLATASVTLLLGLSSGSGLSLPAGSTLALFAAAVVGLAAFILQERRARSPMVDLALLRPPAVSAGLFRALCGYMLLFGPLVLFPQVFASILPSHTVGLVLGALPGGFALTAVGGSRLLASLVPTRPRAIGGCLACLGATGALVAAPFSAWPVAVLLAVLGAGLGLFLPANNAVVMGSIPPRAAALGGGLLNMSRGLGTVVGVASTTYFLHLGLSGPADGARLALVALATAAAAMLAAALLTFTPPEAGEAPTAARLEL